MAWYGPASSSLSCTIPAASACSHANSINLFFPAFLDHTRSRSHFYACAVRSRCGTSCASAESCSLTHEGPDEWFQRQCEEDRSCAAPGAGSSETRRSEEHTSELQ